MVEEAKVEEAREGQGGWMEERAEGEVLWVVGKGKMVKVEGAI